MKRLIILTLLFLSTFQVEVSASELVKVSRMDTRDLVQLYFSFDKTPKFKTTADNRRVDLIFSDTALSSSLAFFAPDENIVKILPLPGKNDLIVSLFFRYKPQNVKLTESADGKLVFEALLGNENSKSYQELADRLKGVAELDRVSTFSSSPAIKSPYGKNWMAFFANYESPVEISVPVTFTPPPFPIIRFLPPGRELNLQLLSPDVFDLAQNGMWEQLGDKVQASLEQTQDLEHQKLLALTFAEILLHRGDFEEAFKQLYLLNEKYHDELLGSFAQFLLAHLRAKYDDPHLAEAEYQSLESTLGINSPLMPYLLLARIEAALATAQYSQLNKLLLRDDIAWPKELTEIVQIHQADYWNAMKQPVKAFAAYQLHSRSEVLPVLPSSLAGYCNTLYGQKRYQDAASCYTRLAPLISDKPLLGLISYRKNMAKLKYQDGATLTNDFSQIEKAYAGTEAGFRAAMKKNDLMFQKSQDVGKQAIEKYSEIAESSTNRAIREEASFKAALVHSLQGQADQSIELLQQFLREFQVGDVRISAQALLIKLLPGEIKRLVDKKEYIKALVLAKKNRELFQKNWIDSKFLGDIAEAYQRIGLFDEAQKLYLYLIEILPVDQREQFYLPMIKATFDYGNYSLVEDYAAQYLYNHPKGKHLNEVLAIRLQSLVADERLAEALHLLPSPLPADKDLYSIAGTLYFRTDDYANCLVALKKLVSLESPLPERQQFMLAECLFQTGAVEEAEQAFQAITETNDFYEQTLFRLAGFERKKGNEKKALSLFKKIVETGKNPQWKRYAERELQIATVIERM
jgi:tetratricopeptide (TPR) repeat protein